MSIFDDIRELKSGNDLEGAWQIGYQSLQSDSNNEFLKTSLFWVIYAALKTRIEPIKSRQITTPRPDEQQEIDRWGSRLTDLNLALPSENIDFRLWNLFSQTGKFCVPLCAYILQSGSKLFSSEDHKPYTSEKGESPSVVMKVARMVAACYLINAQKKVLSGPRVVALINYAEEHAQDSAAGKTWLAYDKARIFLQAGEQARAREAFLDVLQKKRSESWAWFGLASCYENEPAVAIKLYACGLTFAHDAKFSVSGLKGLAIRLADIGADANASKALNRLMTVYSENGWTPKDDIVALMSSAWYDATLGASDFDSIIRNLAEGADQYTIRKPENHLGILQNVHASGKGANIYVSRDLTLSARKALFPDKKFPPVGTPLKLLCDATPDKPDVVAIEIIDTIDSTDIRYFSGTLRITQNGFGFVGDDIFVQASIASTCQNDTEVSGIAVTSFDKTKNRYGWKAITLNEVNSPEMDENCDQSI